MRDINKNGIFCCIEKTSPYNIKQWSLFAKVSITNIGPLFFEVYNIKSNNIQRDYSVALHPIGLDL